MPDPTWPASLPQYVEVPGYAESPPDLTIRTQMETGPAKVRRRFTAGVRPLKVALVLTPDQVETLDAFYGVSCASGALRFTWVHPRTQAACSMRFTQPPAYGGQGDSGTWQVGLSLEILP